MKKVGTTKLKMNNKTEQVHKTYVKEYTRYLLRPTHTVNGVWDCTCKDYYTFEKYDIKLLQCKKCKTLHHYNCKYWPERILENHGDDLYWHEELICERCKFIELFMQ